MIFWQSVFKKEWLTYPEMKFSPTGSHLYASPFQAKRESKPSYITQDCATSLFPDRDDENSSATTISPVSFAEPVSSATTISPVSFAESVSSATTISPVSFAESVSSATTISPVSFAESVSTATTISPVSFAEPVSADSLDKETMLEMIYFSSL